MSAPVSDLKKLNDLIIRAAGPTTIDAALETIKRMQEKGEDLDGELNGYTPLSRAIGLKRREIVNALIKAGANVNKGNPLITAISNHDVESVKILLENGADKDIKDQFGRTPLFHAVSCGFLQIVNVLIAAGVNVNAKTNKNVTPLHIAADKRIVQALLAAGAEKDAKTYSGETPLFYAALLGILPIVNVLIAAGVDVNAITDNGETPLHVAAHKEIVAALLAAGANKDAAMKDGTTALYFAAEEGHEEIVTALLAAGANKDATRTDGVTPLHIAAQKGHKEIVTALLAAGANKDATRIDGATPLFLAAQNGHTEVVKALLAAGAKVMEPSYKGKSVFKWATEEDEEWGNLFPTATKVPILEHTLEKGNTKIEKGRQEVRNNAFTRRKHAVNAFQKIRGNVGGGRRRKTFRRKRL